jgi:hypothetical protein
MKRILATFGYSPNLSRPCVSEVTIKDQKDLANRQRGQRNNARNARRSDALG